MPEGNTKEGDIRAHHQDIAVGEIDEAQHPIDHGIAEGDERIHTAPGQPLDEIEAETLKFTHKGSRAKNSLPQRRKECKEFYGESIVRTSKTHAPSVQKGKSNGFQNARMRPGSSRGVHSAFFCAH